ncbi:MAG: hypothetical protein P4L22_01645 [Candidatus Babeliales bacterium]|nr:hypothetical protein [Candidatus Babeliales bacterium]
MLIYISNFLQNFANNIFFASAVVGTTLFVLRMLMTVFGGALEIDDADTDFDLESHHHFIPSFKLFTLHSISGFFMMFGLVGLACMHQYNMTYVQSFLMASAAGLIIMLVTAFIFKGALYFESQGDVFDIQQSIGLTGIVYQTIPESGQGKINVVINGTTRELLAQSINQKSIESFAIIKIVNVIDHEIVEVIKI